MTDLRATGDRSGVRVLYQRHGWLLVCALPVVVALAVRGPMPIDETRYLSVAWEMWQHGDFVLPTLNGVPYTHKPPLLFWLMHLGWSLFGVNAWWPRLIPFLAAVAAILLTRQLAARLYPEPASRVPETAAWLLAGTFAWTAFVTVLLFDMLLVVCVMAALVALERVERAPLSSWCAYAAATAAGLLTKGPAMLIFALAPALFGPWWSVEAQRRKGRWYGAASLALLGALGVAGLWVWSAYEAAGAAFVHTILWEQSATRVLHSIAHPHPWWFYGAVFPLNLLPWLLWPTAWRGLHTRGTPRADRLALATLFPAFVLFSIISGKQAQYLLPLVPMAVLWLAPRVARPAMTLVGATPAIFFFLLGAALVAATGSYEPAHVLLITGLAAFGGGLFFLALGTGANRHGAIRRLAFSNAMAVALITIAFFSSVRPAFELDTAAAALRHLDEQSRPLAWIGPYDGQMNFVARLRHPVSELDLRRPEQLAEWIAAHPTGELLIYSRREMDTGIGAEWYRQRYRSGWLAIVSAAEARVASRNDAALNATSDQSGSK